MIIQVQKMKNDFNKINEIMADFISANKSVFADEKLANKHDFEKNISLTAYHNLLLADVVELFYDIHIQNINNLEDEIAIAASNNPTKHNKLTAGTAQMIHEQIVNSIDEEFGLFNAMSTQERNALASNLSVTFMSPSIIEQSRRYILENKMAQDNTYKSDIMNHVRNEKCEHFIDYAKHLSEDFNKKYSKQVLSLYKLKELLQTNDIEQDYKIDIEPDSLAIKRTNKMKQKQN